jgi:drug/metabolite transporter (DMT)-like permease
VTEAKRTSANVDLVLLGAAAVWGASYLAAKDLTAAGSLWGMMALRFGLAGIILAAVALFRRSKFSKLDVLIGSAIGVGLAIVMTFETNAIALTSATNSGLIISLSIIFTPIIEGAVNKFWLPRNFFVAAGGAIMGVGFLVGGGGFQEPNLGDFLMLIAAVLRAGYQVAQGKLTFGRKVDNLNMTVFQTLSAGLIFLVVDPAGTVSAAAAYGAKEWALMAFLILFCTIYGFFAMTWGIRKTSASRIALLQGTEPVWAVVIAVIIGGESMGLLGLLGAVLIIGSCYWGLGLEQRARTKRSLPASN